MEKINRMSVQNPRMLAEILRAMNTEMDAVRALANEMRTDHATFKTLADELTADHATFKAAADKLLTAVGNLCLDVAGAATGTTAAKAKTANNVDYLIDGAFYTKNATDDLWTLTGFDVTNAKFNKCLLCLDSSGDPQIEAGTEADTAGAVVLPDIPADYAVIAILQVNPTGTGDFTGGTTDLDDGTVVPNAAFTDVAFAADTVTSAPATLSASAPATLSASAVTDQVEAGR